MAKLEKSEIRDEEINVEEIMRKIRENIKRRKEAGEFKLVDSASAGSDEKQESLMQGLETRIGLDYLNSNWDIQNNSYFISSHRGLAGKALVKGRKLVHGEVRRYVDPVIWKQKEFNERVAQVLNQLTRGIEGLYSSMKDLKKDINQVRDSIPTQIDVRLAQNQIRLSSEIKEQVGTVVAAMNEDIENRAWLAGMLDKRIGNSKEISPEVTDNDVGVNYFLFEERFRGSRADIKGRQQTFLKYFDGCRNILDIGCGRGEFLEILREQGIEGKGVDIDKDMVNFCKSRGFDVERMDAISYLEKLDDNSLGGIFIDQVVEHLEPDYLIRMLGLCHEKLSYSGSIVVETVNPLSFFSFANFYIDMSHKRPVHPETLKFLLGAHGFREIESLFFAVLPEDHRLIGREIDQNADEKERRTVNNYNHNIDMLNNILFGSQDYALIGRK